MHIGILGPLDVVAGGVVEIRGLRLRGLLARLALDAGGLVSTAELVGSLWGDDGPVDQANALQSLVSRVRRTLPDGGSWSCDRVATG